MGAGFIPVPDLSAMSVIQPDMMRQLCKVYDIIFKEKEVPYLGYNPENVTG